MSTRFEPFEEKKKYEKIVDLLKHKVFAGEYRPGDRLPSERELSEALKVSRLSVREAYRALQMFGMVEIRRGNNGGAFIRAPSSRSIIQSVSDLFRFQGITLEAWNEARLIFELDIARLAIRRADEKDFERLEDVIDKACQETSAGKPAHNEHIRFHLCLAEIARNPILFTAYRSMMDLLLNSLVALNVSPEHARNVAQAHRHILTVMKQGEVGPFLRIIEEHVQKAGENLIEVAKRSPLFDGNMA